VRIFESSLAKKIIFLRILIAKVANRTGLFTHVTSTLLMASGVRFFFSRNVTTDQKR